MNDEAVSPVIGVILLIAITVILAAVVVLIASIYGDDAVAVPILNGQIEDHADPLTAGMADNLVTLENRGGDDCIESGDLEFRLVSQASGVRQAVTTTVGQFFCVGDTVTFQEDGSANVAAGSYLVQVIFKLQQYIIFEDGVAIA